MKTFTDKINETVDYGQIINENVTKEDFVRILTKYTKFLNKNHGCSLKVDEIVSFFMDNNEKVTNDGSIM